jgi:hypothetical protein
LLSISYYFLFKDFPFQCAIISYFPGPGLIIYFDFEVLGSLNLFAVPNPLPSVADSKILKSINFLI